MGHTHIVLYNIIRYNLILFLLPHKAVARCTNSLRNLISAIPVENYFFFGFISFFLNIQRLFAHLKLELGEKKDIKDQVKKKNQNTFKRKNKHSYHYRKKHKFDLPGDQNLSEIFCWRHLP